MSFSRTPSQLRALRRFGHPHHNGGRIVARFTEGHRKVGGREKFTPNKRTVMGREFAERLVNDPEYIASVEARAKAGKLPPGVEVMLWYYALGKPKEQLEVSGSVSGRDVSTMDTSELLQELQAHHTATGQFLAQHAAQRGAHTQND